MQAEYNSISKHLPKDVHSLLDIGCGLAGVDFYLSKHYDFNCNIYLLDKSGMDDEIHFGFEDKGSFYNSLEMSKQLLVQNGVPESKIFLQEVTQDNKILFEEKFELIISLISWGFHYPIEVYLEQVFNKLSDKGALIIDVRKSTNGKVVLNEKFNEVIVLEDFAKHERIKCIK